MSEEEKPKIIIDSDWKSQAQAERDKLAEEEAKSEQAKGGADGKPGELPTPDFRALVGMIGMQALMSLGAVADRQSGQAVFDPGYARHMIELLGVIEEKTKGNLEKEEEDELKGLLHELRSRYVELSRLVAEGKIPQAGAPGQAPTDPANPGNAGPSLHT